MDGRVGAIRAGLDAENFEEVQILSYAAKCLGRLWAFPRRHRHQCDAYRRQRTYQIESTFHKILHERKTVPKRWGHVS